MAVGFDRLGKILVGAKMITEQQLNEALAAQKQKGGGKLGSTLVKMGLIEEEKLLGFLAQQYRMQAVDLKMYQNIDPAIIKLVPLDMVKKHMVLPLKRVGATLTIAMAERCRRCFPDTRGVTIQRHSVDSSAPIICSSGLLRSI